MKKRLICLLLSLAMMVSFAGCGRRSQRITQGATTSKSRTVKLQKPPKRQRLFLPPKSQSGGRSSTVDEQTQNLTVTETKRAPELDNETTIETGQTEQLHGLNGSSKISYVKELKAYKKAISKLKGKSFVLTMNADVDLQANERGRREYAQENINLTANIKKNGFKRMELSGNCSVTASGTMTAFNFYQNKDTAYVEYTSPRYATAQLDKIPTESMLNYQFDITEEDVRSAQTAEDGVVMVVDGSVLNLQEILEDLLRSGFDSVTCDAVELQLWTDKKGRPSELDLFYTVEFTLGNASATADYEETLTFTDYGKAKINKPAELIEKKKEPRQEQTAEVEPQETPDLYLDEELEPEPEEPEPDLVPMSDSSAMEAYETILDEYRRACAVSIDEYRENAETEYPHVNPELMDEYHTSFHQSPEAEEPGDASDELYELIYAYYDIDGNGIEELIISESLQEIYLFDLYAFDGQNAVKIFPDVGVPIEDEEGRTSVRVNKDGVIVKQYPGDSDYYRLAKNGYSLEHISGMAHEDDSIQADWQILAEDIDGGSVAHVSESHVAEAYWEKLETYRAKLTDELEEVACYTLCDITGDGVEELIVATWGANSDGTYQFFTFKGDNLEELGTLDKWWSEYNCLYRDEDGGLIFYYSDMSELIDRVSYDGAQIVTTRLSEYNSGDEDDYDDEDYELEEMRLQEWESENAFYLSEELKLWPANLPTPLERTFGVSLMEGQSPEEGIELSDYLSDLEAFHQLVGGEPEDDREWRVSGSIRYGGDPDKPDSDEVSYVILLSTQYRLCGAYITEDFNQARESLMQDGWEFEEDQYWDLPDEYEDSFLCIKAKEGKDILVYAVDGVVAAISYGTDSYEE